MRSVKLLLVLAFPAQVALAQGVVVGPTDTLSLQQAIDMARANNPLFQQTKNQVRTYDARVRTAYGALLPSVSTSVSARYTQGGNQVFQGIQLGSNADSYSGSYGVSFGYNISAAAAFEPRAARADRAAAEATVTSSSETLRSNVTTQYIQTLEQQATAALNDTLVQTSQGQLDLASAKMKVGAGTILDVRTAEVALGQAQVAALQAHNQATIEKLKLFQLLGVAADTNVQLTTAFTVTAQPPASLDSLIALALRVNPDLEAKRSTRVATTMQVRSAKTQYLPSLSLGTGIGGTSFGKDVNSDLLVQQSASALAGQYSSCLSADSIRMGAGLAPRGGCELQTLSPSQIQAIRDGNNPLNFHSSPISFFASLSLPIFNNFQREAQIEQAKVARDNAAYDLKARTIQARNDVTTAYLNLITAAKTVELQETNARQATQALAFANESYRVGSKTFLDVITSRGQYQQALVARLNSIYDYHKAFAALEAAVGRPLR